MTKRFALGLLSVVIVATLVEIGFYFIYVFKPADRLAGRDIGVPRGIPETSELFTPALLNKYATQNNGVKKYYIERLKDFSTSLAPIMGTKSSFVSTVEANYVVSGKVFKITSLEKTSDSPFVGYDITLENLTGDKFYDHLTANEVQYIKVSRRDISSDGKSFVRNYATVADIKVGDHLVIKRSTNLLNPTEVAIEVEILRTSK